MVEEIKTTEDLNAIQLKMNDCLVMLQGNTDEHKFAGLLMITKLTNIPKNQIQDFYSQVINTVGLTFFQRLLKTSNLKAQETTNLSPFQILGLTLISSFCMDPTIAENFSNESILSFTCQQLASVSNTLQIYQDCIQIIAGISTTCSGQEILLNKYLAPLFAGIRNVKELTIETIKSENAEESNEKSAISSNLYFELLERLIVVIDTLAHDKSFWRLITNSQLQLLRSLMDITKVGAGVSKIIVSMFVQFITNCSDLSLGTECFKEIFNVESLVEMKNYLFTFLRMKWPHQERDLYLHFILLLMQNAGMEWMLTNSAALLSMEKEKSANGKFIIFVLKIVSLEAKLMLDDVESIIVQMEEAAKVMDMDDIQARESKLDRIMAILPVCYGIIECSIISLVGTSNVDAIEMAEKLDYEALLDLRKCFSEFFSVILNFLSLTRDFMKTNRYKSLEESNDAKILDVVIVASIRVVGAWIAEDSDTLETDIIDLLPFLVTFKSMQQKSVENNADLDSKKTIPFQLDDIDDDIDSDDELDMEALESMLQRNLLSETSSTVDTLRFILPGLFQLSALPECAQPFASHEEVIRRLMQFCGSMCENIATARASFDSVPILSLTIGVFINLLLNEGDENSQRNEMEWCRSISFFIPLACTCGNAVRKQSKDVKGNDHSVDSEQLYLHLHVVAVVLLIVGKFQYHQVLPCKLPTGIKALVDDFDQVVKWTTRNPPNSDRVEAMELYELVCTIAPHTSLDVLR